MSGLCFILQMLGPGISHSEGDFKYISERKDNAENL